MYLPADKIIDIFSIGQKAGPREARFKPNLVGFSFSLHKKNKTKKTQKKVSFVARGESLEGQIKLGQH